MRPNTDSRYEIGETRETRSFLNAWILKCHARMFEHPLIKAITQKAPSGGKYTHLNRQVSPNKITHSAFPHQGIKCISTLGCWLIFEASKLPKAMITGVIIKSPYKKILLLLRFVYSLPSLGLPLCGFEVWPITIKMTPINEIIVCMIEKVFIFSLRTHTASNTVSKGPKLRNIETLTIGSERIHTKMIIMMKQMWPRPTMNVFLLNY